MAGLADHPNIVPVISAGISGDGRPYIVMMYYPRPNLAVRAASERLGVAEVLRIGIQIASAVETAHRAGILHRDIKPANMLINQYGAPGLTDFGIAGTIAEGDDEDTGVSVPWSAPEVLYATGPTSVRSDVYSLAATLWHLLVGRSPFEVRGGDNSAVRADAPGPRQPAALDRPRRRARLAGPAAAPGHGQGPAGPGGVGDRLRPRPAGHRAGAAPAAHRHRRADRAARRRCRPRADRRPGRRPVRPRRVRAARHAGRAADHGPPDVVQRAGRRSPRTPPGATGRRAASPRAPMLRAAARTAGGRSRARDLGRAAAFRSQPPAARHDPAGVRDGSVAQPLRPPAPATGRPQRRRAADGAAAPGGRHRRGRGAGRRRGRRWVPDVLGRIGRRQAGQDRGRHRRRHAGRGRAGWRHPPGQADDHRHADGGADRVHLDLRRGAVQRLVPGAAGRRDRDPHRRRDRASSWPPPAGKRICIQVRVIRADGSNASPTFSKAGCA